MPFNLRGAAAVVAVAAFAGGAHAQKIAVGSPAPAIKVGKWVKGTPVPALKKGNVYVVEFWATWCGPCKTSIPHLTEIAKKFQGKATIIGVSISENAPDYHQRVQKFVASMGPKMNYVVASDDAPAQGSMARNWMDAAGQNGIPTAFVVDRTGKIAWIGHPMNGLDEVLPKVVAGTFDIAAEKKRAAGAESRNAQLQAGFQKFSRLAQAGKFDEALKQLDVLERQYPDLAPNFKMARFSVLVRTDEPAANKLAAELGEGIAKENPGMLNQIAWTMIDDANGMKAPDLDVVVRLAQRAVELSQRESGEILDTLAYAYYKKGNFAEALKTQEEAVKKIPADAPKEMREEMEARLQLFKSKQ